MPMSGLLQTVIPAAATFLVGYQGALTRTSRLRKNVRADLELLRDLPDDHPGRATLSAHIEKRIDTLVRREAGQYEPIIPVGTSFGVHTALTVMMAVAVLILGLEAVGLYHPAPDPAAHGFTGPVLGFYAALMLVFAGFAFRAWRRAHATR
jgi:hypothetical protein